MNQSLTKTQMQTLIYALCGKLGIKPADILEDYAKTPDIKSDKYNLSGIAPGEVREMRNLTAGDILRIRSSAANRGLSTCLVDRVLYVSLDKAVLSMNRERIKDRWHLFDLPKGQGIECKYSSPIELKAINRITKSLDCDTVKIKRGIVQVYRRLPDELPLNEHLIGIDARAKALRGYIVCYPQRGFIIKIGFGYCIAANGEEISLLKTIDYPDM